MFQRSPNPEVNVAVPGLTGIWIGPATASFANPAGGCVTSSLLAREPLSLFEVALRHASRGMTGAPVEHAEVPMTMDAAPANIRAR
jgi:hypothetical protein